MVFAVQDFDDLLRLLDERPEWREDLRRRVLGDELLELPALMREVTTRVEQLVEAQSNTEAQIRQLADAQKRTQKEVGSLANVLGATIEDDAEETLRAAALAHGWTPVTDPWPLSLNGDVDVAMQVEEPSGDRFWLLSEGKFRLRPGAVQDWAQQLNDPGFRRRLTITGVAGPSMAYALGLRVYPESIEVARRAGIGVLNPNGERLAPTKRWD